MANITVPIQVNLPDDWIEQIVNRLRNDPEFAQSEYRTDEWCTDCKEYDKEKHCCPRFNHVIETTLQEVQPERKKGKWIFEILDGMPGYRPTVMFCSKCGRVSIADYSYCPSCGAEMEGEDG